MPVTMSIMQREDVEKLVLEERAGLPKLTRMYEVQMYNTAGSSIGICGAIVVVILVVLLFKGKCKKCYDKRWKRVVVQPTSTVEPHGARGATDGSGHFESEHYTVAIGGIG